MIHSQQISLEFALLDLQMPLGLSYLLRLLASLENFMNEWIKSKIQYVIEVLATYKG